MPTGAGALGLLLAASPVPFAPDADTIGTASLRRLSSGEALSWLWSSSLSTGETAFAIATAMVEAYSTYELVSGAVEPACVEIERLWAAKG